MRREYFEQVTRCLQDHPEAVLMTVTEGPGEGSHALVSGDVFLVREEDFPDIVPPASVRDGTHMTRCGGSVIFTEKAGKERTAVVCGCGHVGSALIRILVLTGFRVICLEDRPSFGHAAQEAGASCVLVGDYRDNLDKVPEDAFYVIMTRGHRYDLECLESILRKDFLYAGMMGSRSRVRAARQEMLERGLPEESIRRLFAPVGVPIGAETPAEIAVSAAAEMIREGSALPGSAFTPEIRDALLSDQPRVLVTITGRRGPAPRRAGTKMVVFRDGTAAGTIGGGCAESTVIRTAARMLREGSEKTMRMRLDLTGRDAGGPDGMVCGGVAEVFLEA